MTQQVDGCNIQIQLNLKNSHKDRKFEDSIKEAIKKIAPNSGNDVRFVAPGDAEAKDPEEVRDGGSWGYAFRNDDRGFLVGFSSNLETGDSTLLVFSVENTSTSIDNSMQQMINFMNTCIALGRGVSVDSLEIVTYSENLTLSSVPAVLLNQEKIPSEIKTNNPDRFSVEYSGDTKKENLSVTVRYENGVNRETKNRALATSMSLRHHDNGVGMVSFINDGDAARLVGELISKLG